MTTTSGKGPMGPGGGSRAPRAGEVDGAPEADASSGDGTPGGGPGAGEGVAALHRTNGAGAVGVTVAELPLVYAAVAATVAVSPTEICVVDTLTVRLVTVDNWIRGAKDPLCPSNVPVIVAVPAATAVTVPSALTVTTAASLEVHAGVTAALVPSL